MATFYSNRSNGYRLRLEITVNSQDIGNNTSSVTRALYIENQQARFEARSNGKLVFNNKTIWSASNQNFYMYNFESEILLHQSTANVKHDASGNLSISVSADFQTVWQHTAWHVPPLTLSGSMSPDPILRTVWIKDGSNWVRAIPWIKDGSTWKRAIPWIKDGSTWRRAGG